MAEPKRAKLRKDIDEPTFTKSSKEKLCPGLSPAPAPAIDKEDPNRT
jgi:hypothetical protein